MAYPRALAVCACGAGMHLLLDLMNDAGVKLLWPFQQRWIAWDLAREVDPALLAILLAGLLLPALLNLVSEEIGARGHKRPGQRGAIVALTLTGAYLGLRAMEHQRAVALLDSRVYQQEAPLRAGAFPNVSPLLWRGVVETETAIHEVDVSLTPGAEFDPRAARSQFKPKIRRRCNTPPPARPRGNFWHLRASPWRACSPHRMDSRCGFATCASLQPHSGRPGLSPSSI